MFFRALDAFATAEHTHAPTDAQTHTHRRTNTHRHRHAHTHTHARTQAHTQTHRHTHRRTDTDTDTDLEIHLVGARPEDPREGGGRELRAVLLEAQGEDGHESRRHFQGGANTSQQEPFKAPVYHVIDTCAAAVA